MRILIGVDHAPGSNPAVLFGGMLARDLGKPVTLLRVVQNAGHQAIGEQALADAMAAVRAYTSAVEGRVRVGHPAEEIIREAEEGGYGLVVVGERQHQVLRTRFPLGSTAERVIEHAPCPVVVAQGRIGPVRSILLCEGVRDDETLVKRFLQQLPCLLTLAPTITVLHVMSQVSTAPEKSGDILVASVEQLIERRTSEGRRLQRDKIMLGNAGVNPILKIRRGLVVEEIAAEAQTGAYDLMVIGAHPSDGWRRILLDDITRRVLMGAGLPVLVVR
ncbi:MAG: universal stress protein [Anaerolineae bacterium]|nr:universal stress protein [Anaerolineae bacterium]MDW8101149.1 universal stress protein [Anaerolineae bacterium]